MAKKEVLESVENALKYFIEKVFPMVAKEVDFLIRFSINQIPKWEKIFFEIVEIMFSPRQLFRQLVIISTVQVVLLAGVFVAESGQSLVNLFSEAERERIKVKNQLKESINYAVYI